MVQGFRIFQNMRKGIVSEDIPDFRPARQGRKRVVSSDISSHLLYATYYLLLLAHIGDFRLLLFPTYYMQHATYRP